MRCFQPACQHNQDSLPEDIGETIASVSDAYEEGLFFVVEAKHIKAVSRNVMRGRTECHQPKECKSELHIVWSRDKKGNTGETGSNQTLHGNNPDITRKYRALFLYSTIPGACT